MGRKKNNGGRKPAGQNTATKFLGKNLPSFHRPMEIKKRNGLGGSVLVASIYYFLLLSTCCGCYSYGGIVPFSPWRLRIIHEASASRHNCWYHHHDSVVFQKFCVPPSINREATTRRFSKNNPSDNKSSQSLSIRKNMAEASSSSIRNFGIGASSLLRNYWKHYSRQGFVGSVTTSLIVAERTGRFIAEPLARLFTMIVGTKAWWYWGEAQMYLESKLDPWSFPRKSLRSYYIVVPIVEEFLHQFCLLQFLKFICRRLYKTKNDDDQVVSKTPPLWTPWSIITGLVFAAGHIDADVIWDPDLVPMSPLGRAQIAREAKRSVEAFFASIFLLIPSYERHGIFASIGTHAMWDVAVYVPGVREVLLFLHLIHRVGFLRLLLRRQDSSPAKNEVPLLQRICEECFEVMLLYNWIVVPILGMLGY